MNEGTNLDAEGKIKVINELMSLPADEVKKKIDSDPALYKLAMEATEFLVDPTKPNLLSAPTDDSAVSGSQGQKVTDASGDDEEDVVIRVKRKDLGTYGKNRPPEEAFQEILKGLNEKEKHIVFLKQDRIPIIEQELVSAKTELMSTRQKLEEFLKKQKEPEFDAAGDGGDDNGSREISLPENYDQFDPEHSARLIEFLKKQDQELKALKAGKTAIPNNQPQAGSQQVVDPAELEYMNANALTRDPKYSRYFEGLNRDIKTVESDYLSFVRDLAVLNGYSGQIIDERGMFAPKVAEIVKAYDDNSNAAADNLRATATERGIKPPEDVKFLEVIYNVKKYRNKFLVNNGGTPEPAPWADAMDMYIAKNNLAIVQPVTQPNPQVVAAQASHDQLQRALEARKQFSTEPPAHVGPDVTDINKIPWTEFNRLMAKDRKTYTPNELELVKRLYREVGKYTEEEIKEKLS